MADPDNVGQRLTGVTLSGQDVQPITKSIESWNYQNAYVERLMDNASYLSAHPDDTLVLAGPPRLHNLLETPHLDEPEASLILSIGMLQNINISQNKPVIPVQAIGSGRSFYSVGKSQNTATMSRLMINGRNLLRVLSHNQVFNGANNELKYRDTTPGSSTVGIVTPEGSNYGPMFGERGLIDEPFHYTQNLVGDPHQFFANLDSELFLVPFGMAVIFRDKAHNTLGGVYLELCMINGWNIAVSSGQSMIMENVSLFCDRVLPFYAVDGQRNQVALDAWGSIADGGAENSGSNTENLQGFDDQWPYAQVISTVAPETLFPSAP